MGADCKSAGSAYVGSNPTRPNKIVSEFYLIHFFFKKINVVAKIRPFFFFKKKVTFSGQKN